jgi:hypothetical protein
MPFFFFGGTRVWTQGFTLARQTLYNFNYSIRPLLGFRQGLSNYLPGLASNHNPPDLCLLLQVWTTGAQPFMTFNSYVYSILWPCCFSPKNECPKCFEMSLFQLYPYFRWKTLNLTTENGRGCTPNGKPSPNQTMKRYQLHALEFGFTFFCTLFLTGLKNYCIFRNLWS